MDTVAMERLRATVPAEVVHMGLSHRGSDTTAWAQIAYASTAMVLDQHEWGVRPDHVVSSMVALTSEAPEGQDPVQFLVATDEVDALIALLREARDRALEHVDEANRMFADKSIKFEQVPKPKYASHAEEGRPC